MLINGYSLKEIYNIYFYNTKGHLNEIIKDYFNGDYTWDKFLFICRKNDELQKFFKKQAEKENIKSYDFQEYYEHILKDYFSIVHQELEKLPVSLRFNICFYLIENNKNKQLEFDFT